MATIRKAAAVPHTVLAQITYAVFAVICVFSLWRGTCWERLAAFILLLVTVATPLIQDRSNFMDPEARFFLIDLLLLVFFLSLAILVGRVWMIFAAAFQLLSTLSHPAAHFIRGIGPVAYITVFQLYSYGVYLSLAMGTALVWKRAGQPNV